MSQRITMRDFRNALVEKQIDRTQCLCKANTECPFCPDPAHPIIQKQGHLDYDAGRYPLRFGAAVREKRYELTGGWAKARE
jgi:hypothetical protein